MVPSESNPDGRHKCLTTDHKPSYEPERLRIEGLGGHVMYDRINGLAVARSFGDKPHKPFVTAELEFREVECHEGDSILIICDGLVEQNDNEQLMSVVDNAMEYNRHTGEAYWRETALVDVFDTILTQYGTNDNMSAMLVELGPSNQGHAAHIARDDDTASQRANVMTQ